MNGIEDIEKDNIQLMLKINNNIYYNFKDNKLVCFGKYAKISISNIQDYFDFVLKTDWLKNNVII